MSDVSVIVTGIVGVLGIAGTLFATWQTNRSQTANLIRNFEAQRDEARRAGKLALYATYLARANAMSSALTGYPQNGDTETKHAYAATELKHAMQLLYDSHNEVMLTSPSEVKAGIDETTDAFAKAYAQARADGGRLPNVQRLAGTWLDPAFVAMRDDLQPPVVLRRLEELPDETDQAG